MSKKPSPLSARYADARARLQKAGKEVQRMSKARLTELMRLSRQKRAAYVDDPVLMKEDRASLLRSLTAKRTRMPARRAWRPSAFWPSFGWVRHLIALTTMTLGIGPPALWGAMTWLNTATIFTIPSPIEVEWHSPSGEAYPQILPAGISLPIVVHSWGTSYFRFWNADRGYLKANVNIIDHRR